MNKDYINTWLDIAIKDIEVAELLFKNKLYSNSFYHFQQASEKGFKAYAFMTKIYKSEKDVYKDGHYSLKTFKDTLIEMQNGLETLKKIEFNNLIGNSEFELFSNNIMSNDFIPEKKDIIEYPSKFLNEYIQLFGEFKNFSFEFPKKFNKNFDEKIEMFFDSIAKINPIEAENARIEFKEFRENEEEFKAFMTNMEHHLLSMMNMLPSILVLMISNLISHNHNNISRYPEVDFNPLKYYNLRRPIIKKLPEFLNSLNDCLHKLKKINNRG